MQRTKENNSCALKKKRKLRVDLELSETKSSACGPIYIDILPFPIRTMITCPSLRLHYLSNSWISLIRIGSIRFMFRDTDEKFDRLKDTSFLPA